MLDYVLIIVVCILGLVLFGILLFLWKRVQQAKPSQPLCSIHICGTKLKTADQIRNDEVEDYIRHTAQAELLHFKILLLGAGESGKSTVVKQLNAIHKIKLDDTQLETYAAKIHNNTAQCMSALITAAEGFGLKFDDNDLKERIERIQDFVSIPSIRRFPPQLGQDVSILWKHPHIQAAYSRRNEFWLLDAASYYFANVERFSEDDYMPSEEDIIMARVRTTGIITTNFESPPVRFSVVDVGGQRNERKKWIHCFDDVKAILFLVSLAGYDQVMFEDSTKNRMHEELELFEQVTHYEIFKNTPIFLLLNKKDLFESMIQQKDLSTCFPEYKGGKDTTIALEFVKEKFQSKTSSQPLHVEYIAARYRPDVRDAFQIITNFLVDRDKKVISKATNKQKS